MENTVAIVFGRILRNARKESGLSQEQLGLYAGVQRNYISMLELGERQPTLSTLLKIADGLKIKPQKLVGLVGEAMENS